MVERILSWESDEDPNSLLMGKMFYLFKPIYLLNENSNIYFAFVDD